MHFCTKVEEQIKQDLVGVMGFENNVERQDEESQLIQQFSKRIQSRNEYRESILELKYSPPQVSWNIKTGRKGYVQTLEI